MTSSDVEKVAERLDKAAEDCRREASATDSFGFTNIWLAQAHQCEEDAKIVRALEKRIKDLERR